MTAVGRVVEREARVFSRLWRGTVFSSFLTPVLFLAAIGLGLGGLVDERNRAVDGLSYLAFVTPGLLVASAVQAAAGDSLWPVMGGMKWMRYFHGMVATPLGPGDVHLGYVLWIGIRTFLSSVAFLVVGALLGGVPSGWGLLAVPAAVVTALAVAAPLSAYAGTRESDLSFAAIMRLGIVPLFLFSGTFFPIAQLPAAVRPLSWLSPLWHGVELARGATTGGIGAGAAFAHVSALVVLFVVGVLWGRRSFGRRLTQ